MPDPRIVQSNLPELFVFKKAFSYADTEKFDDIVLELEQNVDSIKQRFWEDYWTLNGDEILWQEWKIKYKDYLTPDEEIQNAKLAELDIQDLEKSHKESELENSCSEIASIAENSSEWENSWEAHWLSHTEEVYCGQYILYNSIFDIYHRDFCKSISTERTIEENQIQADSNEYIFNDSDFEFSLEEQLKAYGLPTSFGSKPKFERTKTKLGPDEEETDSVENTDEIYNKVNTEKEVFEESGEFEESDFDVGEFDEVECETDQEEELEIKDSVESKSDFTAMAQDNSDALHVLENITIKKSTKKRKNRKLKNVPKFILEEKSLQKYWRRRFSLFSLFDMGIRLDRESWFSVTPEKVALNLAKRLSCDVIIDAFCGCGGNTIQFAKTSRHVIAIDIDPTKIEMAKHNASIYGVADKIDFIVGDFLKLIDTCRFVCDIVFLSPPWGGPQYKNKKDYDIDKYLLPIGATELVEKVRRITENIALFLPRNANIKQIVKLAGIGNRCEIEHNYLDTRLVAITALYGNQIIADKEKN